MTLTKTAMTAYLKGGSVTKVKSDIKAMSTAASQLTANGINTSC